MLRFVKQHMETIVGVELYPMVSFLIFFTFFVGLIAYVIMMKKGYIKEVESLPLTEND